MCHPTARRRSFLSHPIARLSTLAISTIRARYMFLDNQATLVANTMMTLSSCGRKLDTIPSFSNVMPSRLLQKVHFTFCQNKPNGRYIGKVLDTIHHFSTIH